MSDFIRYDANVIIAAMEDLDGFVTRVQTNLEELEGRLQPIVDTWEGGAQEAYYERKTIWDGAVTTIQTAVTELGRALGQAQENMTATDNQAKGYFGG